MYVVTVEFDIRPQHVAAFLPLMRENASAAPCPIGRNTACPATPGDCCVVPGASTSSHQGASFSTSPMPGVMPWLVT